MGGELVRVEPSSPDEVKNNPLIWNIICEGGIKDFINAFRGHDDEIYLNVATTWVNE